MYGTAGDDAGKAAEELYYYRFPATQGSAKSYNIAQQYGRIEPKFGNTNTSLTNYEKGIRLAGERSVLPETQFEKDLAAGLYDDLNLSEDMVANIRKVTQHPADYQKQSWYINNPELQKIMTDSRFINKSEYLLPYYPDPSKFKLTSSAGDITNSMNTSLATSMRGVAADRLAAERAVASQEGKIITGKGASANSSDNDNTTLDNPWAMPMPSLYTPSQQFLNLTGRTFQNGGSSTNPVYEGELTNDKIKELEQQGFKIEFVEKPNPINLNLRNCKNLKALPNDLKVGGGLYSYNPNSNTSISLNLPQSLNILGQGIANTSNKLWISQDTGGIREWNITLNPWTAVWSRDISSPSANPSLGWLAGALCVYRDPITNTVNPNLLVAEGFDTGSGGFEIVLVDISGPTWFKTTIFNLNSLSNDRQISEVIMNNNGKMITIGFDTVTNQKYVTQFHYIGGSWQVQIDIPIPITTYIQSFFQWNNFFYIGAFTGELYTIQTSPPYTTSYLGNFLQIRSFDSGQSPDCITF